MSKWWANELAYEMALSQHRAGHMSDGELRRFGRECRPRRPRWLVRLAFELRLMGITLRRFFYRDHDWQLRVERFLRKRLGGFWFGQPDNREALSHD